MCFKRIMTTAFYHTPLLLFMSMRWDYLWTAATNGPIV
jgi:hypothetical protein